MNFQSITYRLKITLCFVLFFLCVGAQNMVFTKVFDFDLKPIEEVDTKILNKPVIFVSSYSCAACVKYFTAYKKAKYNLVFMLNNESLLEVRRVLEFYGTNKKFSYFVTPELITKDELLKSATPCLINKNYVYDYDVLDSLTKSFNDNKYRFIKGL
jgi:hypothetical protein